MQNIPFSHTSSATRQSMETIERINNENIRLHDELKELRQLLVCLTFINRLSEWCFVFRCLEKNSR
jgi:hypothetical protein